MCLTLDIVSMTRSTNVYSLIRDTHFCVQKYEVLETLHTLRDSVSETIWFMLVWEFLELHDHVCVSKILSNCNAMFVFVRNLAVSCCHEVLFR